MAEDGKNVGLSFAFAKKKSKIQLVKSVIGEKQDTGSGDEADYIKVVEGRQVKSVKPKEEKKELIIPLIHVNRWRSAIKPEDLEKTPANYAENSAKHTGATNIKHVGSDAVGSVEQQAVKEMLADVARRDNVDGGGVTDLEIPLLMRNKVPEGFETDDRLDVALRPKEPDPADYDSVPVDDFGVAMLRGMGWEVGQGLGKNKQVIAPIHAVARPKGLGLGADRSALLQKNGVAKDGTTKEEEDLALEKGACCLILKGKHKDLYGVVEGLDEDNAQLMVKLTLSRYMASISQYVVKAVSKKEYDRYSKYLNKPQVDRYKEEQNRKQEEESRKQESGKRHNQTDSKDEPTHKKHKSEYEHQRKRKHDHERAGKSSESDSKRSTNGDGRHTKLWLQSNLRVRIVDPNYKKGKYYKVKVVIEDVIDADSCICRTEDNKVLEGLSQLMVETVIPKTEPGYVLIVDGKHRGQLAEILRKDQKAYVATVQLLNDRDKLLDIGFDNICEYTGNIDLEMDF